MRVRCSVLAIILAGCVGLASIASADEMVPFRGVWSGSTVSAVPDPGGEPAFLVVSEGYGEATRLGQFFMSSPHLSYADFSVVGQQIFTADNGDELYATIAGQFEGTPLLLEGTLAGTITGGTGRFAGATGTYDFHIIATFNGAGYDSVAAIDGEISSVGSAK